MNRVFLYFLLFPFSLVLSCSNDPSEVESSKNMDAPMEETVQKGTQGSMIATSENSCSMDSLSFFKMMGVGIMSLRIRPGDSIVAIEKGSGDTLIIALTEERSGWTVNGYLSGDPIELSPFKYATNFENFGFIWMGDGGA
ncbi:MAG: hypothetical protein LPK28_03395 [Bacteroidota bacterium]|nr:hypothetical protein [Bacteroidota bacterium]